MNYVGIDWAYSNAAWCCMSEAGEVVGEGKIPADRDGLAQLVGRLGSEVSASVEMMSGAYWLYEELSKCGWEVKIADARKVATVAPLALKTDKVDARVLSALEQKDLTPKLWIRPLDDRELKEQVLLHMHMTGLRTELKNRVFGITTQWGLRLTCDRLRAKDHQKLLQDHGVPTTWCDSIAQTIELVDVFDERLAQHDRKMRSLARKDPRVKLLKTIPGVGDLLGLALAVEISDISRFSSHKKLIGYAGLAPRIKQSGKSSYTGPLSKSGSKLLRWAAVEAAQCAWRSDNPYRAHYIKLKRKYGNGNPAKAAVARKILTAAWHVLSKQEEFKVCRPCKCDKNAPASSTFGVGRLKTQT